MARNDDGSSSLVPIGFEVNFYGTTRTHLWVNNNGNVTFDAPLSTYTPFPLSDVTREIIAPFFGDVDTRGSGSNVVRYGYGSIVFEGRPAFCATWENVGYYNARYDKLNSFQLLLVDRSDRAAGDFDIVFNYDKIQWEAGSASGGVNGLGGTPARAGFSNGTGEPGASYEVPGSNAVGGFLDGNPNGLTHRSVGSVQEGRLIYAVTGGVPSTAYVYVAFGDSYSSGEGVPPFENGTNYPFSFPQDNTLADGGDGCHRSLANYAKLNSGVIATGEPAILVDRTCSGAVLDAGNGTSQAGKVSIASEDYSQVDQALERLSGGFGLGGEDVNLVTLTGGGNDANFSEIIAACLVPNLLREAMRYHDLHYNIEFAADHLATCERLDSTLFWGLAKSDDAIDELYEKVYAGHLRVGSSFPNAALYHVTYPSILPSPDVFGGDTCGGILKEDANYAIGRVQRINDKIEEAAESSGAAVVDLENSFGENPLCPADPDLALAHGIPQERIEAVVAEVAGPDSPIYGELSSAVSRINSMARCIEAGVFFLSPFCALKWGGVDDAIDDLTEAFSANFEADVLKLFLAPGDTEDERAENFTFLFHPNANGQKVMACQVLDAWARDLAVYAPGSDCEPLVGSSLRVYEWDGDSILNMTPIRVVPDQRLPVVFNGFDYHSDVRVTYRSEPVDGGLFQTDSTGTLSTELVIPAELSPGVHTVSFEGTNNRTPRTIDVLIELDGEPEPLASYGTYFEGFQPYEAVHVTYQGIDFLDLTANQDGGLLVEVPVPARGEIQLGVVGETSGTTIDRAVDVAPLPVSQSLDSVVNTASLLGEAFPALGTEWAQVIALLSQGSQADSSRSAARAVAQATVAVEALDVDQVTGIPGTKAALVDWLLDIGQAYAGNEIAAATPDADGDKLDVARQLLGDADSDRSNGDSLQAALAYRDATIAAFDSNWWSLTRYGIVAFDDVDLRNSSIGGRILSGDATTLRSWSLGSDLAVDSSRVDIGVGGVIDIANGSVRSGSVTYGTLGQISSVSVRGTVEQASLPLDIESARDAVVAAVASIADAPANGNWVDVNPWWTTFRFKGTSPDVNVFDVEADQLENAHAVQIDAPPGALTVIRVSGDHYSAQQLSTIRVLNSQGASADAGNLIWMFTTASSVEIGPSLHWRGSILAPTATVTLHNSVPLDGSLIANSVLGAITHHWLPPVDHPQLP